MALPKAPNYTKEQEKALTAAFKHIATMTDDDKRAIVKTQAEGMGKAARSIISKLSVMGLWVPYKPKQASSVKRAPTRSERVRAIQAQLNLGKDTLTSLERALASDLVTLIGGIENVLQAGKVAEKETEAKA